MEKLYILILCFFQMFISYGQPWTKILISQQPQDTIVCQNGMAIFSVTASGAPTITYQWYHNGSVIQGATQDTLTLSTVQQSDAGSYYCLLTNPYGPVSSNTATLTVIVVDPPPINGPTVVPEYCIKTYSVYQTTGSTYFFSVLCGTIVNTFPSSIVVQWTLSSYAQVRCTETNNMGCVSNLSVLHVIVGEVGMEEDKINSWIRFYPNPSSDKITVESSELSAGGRLSILNLSGQELLHRNITGPTTSIDVSHLSPGIYMVKMVGEKGVHMAKFVKQ